MLVALVMLGVTACEQNVTIDTPTSEGLSFYAEIAMTRASINDEDGDKVWNTTWESGDTLRVADTEGNSFDFVYSTAELNKFTCENPDASILVGKTVTIELVNEIPVSYNREKGLVIYQQVESFNPSSTEAIELHPKNSFLRFTHNHYNGVEITLTYPEDFNCAPFVVDTNNTTSNTFITSDSGEMLVSFLVPEYDEIVYENGVPATLSFSMDGVKCKEATIKIKAGKVYNLGTLAPQIYFQPYTNWSEAGAWYAAYFYDAEGNYMSAILVDNNSDGFLECDVPYGMSNVIFCRMNPAAVEFDWEYVWNQTRDEKIGTFPNNYYYGLDWNAGLWGTKDGYEPIVLDTLYFKPNNNWVSDNARFAAYFYGSGETWASMTDTNGDGIYEVACPAGYPNVIFCRMNPATTDNSWDNKWNQTNDLTITIYGADYYILQEDSWNYGNGYWTYYTAQ